LVSGFLELVLGLLVEHLALLLFGTWAVSVLPLVALGWDFGNKQWSFSPAHRDNTARLGSTRASATNVGLSYALLYSHSFVFPLLFQSVALLCLYKPLSLVLTELDVSQSSALLLIVVSLPVILIIPISVGEFKGATAAPWDVNLFDKEWAFKLSTEGNQKVETEDRVERVKRHFTAYFLLAPEAKTELRASRHFRDDLDSDLKILAKNLPRSWTYWAHFLGFPAQALAFLVTYVTLALVLVKECPCPDVVALTVVAVFFMSLWPIQRFAFLLEKRILFKREPLLIQNYLIMAVFVIAYLLLIGAYRQDTVKTIAQFATLISAIGLWAAGVWRRQYLVRILGSASSPAIYLTLSAALGFLVLPLVLQLVAEGFPTELTCACLGVQQQQ